MAFPSKSTTQSFSSGATATSEAPLNPEYVLITLITDVQLPF